MTGIDAVQFFENQLTTWQLARDNFAALAKVQTRSFQYVSCQLCVQFNPARIVSTGASIDRKTLNERPCFLCAANRPTEQQSIVLLNRYELLVNPFPILPHHFTLPSTQHERQSIRQSYIDMMRLTQLLPNLFLFYNGPRCGASAPDHLHFQAGERGIVPLERELHQMLPTASRIQQIDNYVVPAYVISAGSAEESAERFHQLYDTMPVPDGDWEPMMNILAWQETTADGTQLISVVIPRTKHRPNCYSAEGDNQFLISPGALDMGGLIITPRREDFDRMTAERAQQILSEVAL